jgi:hypothetical protein
LFFIKHFDDSLSANNKYKSILILFRNKFGNGKTMAPFEDIETNVWIGKENITMYLNYNKIENSIVLSIEQNASSIIRYRNNLFQESEYSEKFTKYFKEFDNRNGYKGLKFGMQQQQVKTIVKIKGPNILKHYEVLNDVYKEWFYQKFDFCYLSFNTEKRLYDVELEKDVFSDQDYGTFLKEATDLFGTPNEFRSIVGEAEITRWIGNNFYVAIMRLKDGSLGVSLDALDLDDTSPSDKLY